MKTTKNLCLEILALSLLATPALAQRGHRGGAVTGAARAGQMQAESKKGDKEPNPSKGSKAEKTRTREGWEKKAKHNAKGHSR